MMQRITLFFLLITLLLSACGSAASSEQPTATTRGGETYPSPVQPVDLGTYPAPGQVVVPIDFSAYPAPGQPGPYDPVAADDSLNRVDVTIEPTYSEILILPSAPEQAVARLLVQLPTPCHQPRVKVNLPDGSNNIAVEVYAVVDPNQICTQVLAQAEVRISMGALPAGAYQVLVNGEAFKSFTLK